MGPPAVQEGRDGLDDLAVELEPEVVAGGEVDQPVAVDPAHQGSGIGRALLEHAEQAARQAGYDSIYLYTHELMAENLALYERIGYVEYDRRREDWAARVFMRKQLG